MNKDKFVIFLFGLIIILLGWMVTTTCHSHEEEEVVASLSCRTDANGYTYCLNTKTGEKFIIKPTIEGIRT